MIESFDPYHKWLGIPPKDQPPNHYRLLGVELFESDPDVIDAAASKQMAYVRNCATGPHTDLSQKILNELAAARVCLLKREKKAAYDKKLRAELAPPDLPEAEIPPEVPPLSVPTAVPVAALPLPAASREPVPTVVAHDPGLPRPHRSETGTYAAVAVVSVACVLLVATLLSPNEKNGTPPINPPIIQGNGATNGGDPSGVDSHAEEGTTNGQPSSAADEELISEAQVQNGNPEETKPEETKPEETKPEETKPEEPETEATETETRIMDEPPPLPDDWREQLNRVMETAATPTDFKALTEQAFHFTDLAILADNATAAEACLVTAIGAARNAQDVALVTHATLWFTKLQDEGLSDALKEEACKRAGTGSPRLIALTHETPPMAVAPFEARQAAEHQQAWATNLNLPVEVSNTIGMKFVLIPPGEFMMGSPAGDGDAYDDEKPQHRVRITKPFYFGIHEVTQAEYRQVMGSNPSGFSQTGTRSDRVSGIDTSRLPVEQVSWENAVEFCRKLSASSGERSAGREYRLPTEAEWEYTCRAGTATPFHFGSDLSAASARFDGSSSSGRPTAIGSYSANGFGLYDMHGNVHEWCADWFSSSYYANSPMDDPLGPTSGSARVRRGGSWLSIPRGCRSAFRSGTSPDRGFNVQGFRVALVIPDAFEKPFR
ncbi:MAG: formylglycine-generating enzyme family protein [Thermoguttaceae bacterium]|jgi:formylglycine-generating enzyme required for sulfatase activity|nr:formylglycine-generating enzyme family protein [Thermoguttaceae bacterium]